MPRPSTADPSASGSSRATAPASPGREGSNGDRAAPERQTPSSEKRRMPSQYRHSDGLVSELPVAGAASLQPPRDRRVAGPLRPPGPHDPGDGQPPHDGGHPASSSCK